MSDRGAQVAVRPARPGDVPAVATLFGEAFDDYRRGFGVSAAELTELWEGSLAARIPRTLVAETPDGALVGFAVYVRPGEKEQYGGATEGRRRMSRWRRTMRWAAFWRPALLFIPMGLAYARRHTRSDELYVSLVGVDPQAQGRGVGQVLLAAVEQVAREGGAQAILLHTASNNVRALRAYRRAGFDLICTVRAPWRGPAGIPAYVAMRKALLPDATPRLEAYHLAHA